jgi:TDG/mug DNA glycosylase family protein
VPRLRDVVCERPRLLLVGINPGLRSAAVGHHFAGLGNPFWRLLYAARIIPESLTPDQDRRLAEFGIALTNLCPRPTRSASDLAPAELRRGRAILVRKCRLWQPRAVALVGVVLYPVVFGRGGPPGPGPKPDRLADAPVFVVPNPSGLNASFPGFKHKLVWYRRLRAFVDRPPATPPTGSAPPRR